MQIVVDTKALVDGMRRQACLADMAQSGEVRAMHEALEQLYRSQLVAAELARRLGAIGGASGEVLRTAEVQPAAKVEATILQPADAEPAPS